MRAATRVDLGINVDVLWWMDAACIHHGYSKRVQNRIERIGVAEGDSEDEDRIGDGHEKSEMEKPLEGWADTKMRPVSRRDAHPLIRKGLKGTVGIPDAHGHRRVRSSDPVELCILMLSRIRPMI